MAEPWDALAITDEPHMLICEWLSCRSGKQVWVYTSGGVFVSRSEGFTCADTGGGFGWACSALCLWGWACFCSAACLGGNGRGERRITRRMLRGETKS